VIRLRDTRSVFLVNYPTLHAFGVLRVGLVRELGLEPIRVAVE
jgi:hypothetical protein